MLRGVNKKKDRMKGRQLWCNITKVVCYAFKELKRWMLALKI